MMSVIRCLSFDDSGWLTLRQALWPEDSPDEHRAAVVKQFAAPDRFVAFRFQEEGGETLGFAEASIRYDYVNGTSTSPVVFLEGIYVRPETRCRGIARHLVEAVAAWGQERGCREMASDALIDNLVSHQMHQALGFEETERVVCFRKMLS